MAQDILGPTWNLSLDGVKLLTEDDTLKDKNRILNKALDTDIKEIGAPILAKLIPTNTISNVVLQIQKIRNISAPKANENSQAAPRMLKIVLTDGESYIQAIEKSPIPSINRDKTAPGNKILIKSAKIASGYLLLDSNNCTLLGGKVATLYEKWELAKSIQFHNRQNSTSIEGPPAWVNFGCKIQTDIVQDKQFKSLDNNNKEAGEGKENSKFDMQRQDAIAEATSGAIKKVFGGGVKQPAPQSAPPTYKKPTDFNRDKRGPKNANSVKTFNNFNVANEPDEKPQKPLERLSLFAFLEDKLPAAPPPEPERPQPARSQFNANQKYSNQNYQQNSNYKSRPQNNPKYRNNDSFSHYNNQSQNNYYNKPQQQQNDYSNTRPHKPHHQQQQQPPPPPQNNFVANKDINNIVNNMNKMQIDNQFASRSIRQHLNLAAKDNKQQNNQFDSWKVGDECQAKYWEDGKFYNAIITAVTDKTNVVKFKGYGNIEEVLKNDCLPANGRAEGSERRQYGQNQQQQQQHHGTMEFRRSSKTYRRQ